MLRGAFERAGEKSPGELRAAYDDLLAETVRTVGVEQAARESAVEEARLTALLEDESPSLTLTEAASVLAVDPDRPDSETVVAESRDVLLMGMSIAVLDVETLASRVDAEMEPKEIQQKTEGRRPMPLDEYALLHSYVESQQ